MLWVVGLIALLPLAWLLMDRDRAIGKGETSVAYDSAAPDLLRGVMQAGVEAEPVWGAWVRVSGFDPEEDLLMIETDQLGRIHVKSSASADGDTYLLLSDGTRIVLERVRELPRPAEDIVFFLHN